MLMILSLLTSNLFALLATAWTYPAQAPGVENPLGIGADPAPVKWYNSTSMEDVYLFPDVNFAKEVWLRVSPNLSDVQYDLQGNNHSVYNFTDSIATEAADLSQTADGKWVMYISAVQINTVFVITSDTEDPLGPWSSAGNVRHNGQDIVGYDAHALNLPNGDRYLTWSTSYHAPPSISIIKLASVNSSVPGTPLSAIVVPDQFYEQIAIPSGNYSFLNHTCCGVTTANPFNAPVIEAPSSWVVENKTINLGYAANSYADPTYNTLITTASIDADLLDPSSWTKSPYNPILSSSFYSSTYAPGSGGFFLGPNGNPRAPRGATDEDVWFAYGATQNATSVGSGSSTRTVRAQKVGWDEQGRILRMTPVNVTRDVFVSA